MFRKALCITLPLLLLIGISWRNSNARVPEPNSAAQIGTLEKLIVASGQVALDLDLPRLRQSAPSDSKRDALRFEVKPNSFFTILTFNNALRGAELGGSMELLWGNSTALPESLNASANRLVIEKIESEAFDLVIRDRDSGFVFFNIEGTQYDYDAETRSLRITDGRVLISEELAKQLGRPADARTVVGGISIAATMSPIEVTSVVNGEAQSATLPVRAPVGTEAPTLVNGPDVIVGELSSTQQFGSAGTRVGLAVGTDSCNNGNVELNWFAMPNPDHPVIPQSMYRMSGGTTNDQRFEQIGHSWLKHAFTALQNNVCGFGCTPSSTGGTHLGTGCSDPYGASLNGSQSGIGSRAWVNPFTGVFPSGGNNHSGHVHDGTSHRVLVEAADLLPGSNPGATYFVEAQYVTPHEYAWCQSHPGQCNMYNNASYRRVNVSGSGTSFTFANNGPTVRMTPAINAWTGATINKIEPVPGQDGQGFIGYKITNPSPGVWHYEYAINNQNLDRAIQSFSVPLGCGVTISNVDFHAPLNHPGFPNDGTFNSAGYSNTPWTPTQTNDAIGWSSETFAQNQNANAIRWGTMYNFRFDSNRPPAAAMATIGYFKTGSPSTVAIQAPTADPCNPLQLTSAISRKTHGSAGDFDIDLPLSGEPGVESRDGGGAHTIVITFTNDVVSGSASIASGVAGVKGMPSFAGKTMKVTIGDVADKQKVMVLLSGVTDTSSQVLPDTTVPINMLIGDTSGNKTVNSSDIAMTKAQVAQPVTSANFRTDVNANGSVTASDVSEVKANTGHTLP
jgi:hypothetical protein